ncbi:hypothetical protein [Streptomyces rimosus]|uniref:hypothetical protein n=1 Tax=Streptomyces rimosus TaxID=1927 RepID=UPI0004C0B290|nr:hypothetical protein [Streptomyces rimosus]
MSTLQTIATGSGIGGLLPLLTAIVQRPHWSVGTKKIVAVVMAVVTGVITVISSGGLDQFQHGWLTFGTVGAVVAASQAAYDLIWKPSSLAPAIESATSPKRAPAAE